MITPPADHCDGLSNFVHFRLKPVTDISVIMYENFPVKPYLFDLFIEIFQNKYRYVIKTLSNYYVHFS